MTENRLLSSAPEGCLDRGYASSQKGGTLIAEDVHDLATHELRLDTPDTYRPSGWSKAGPTRVGRLVRDGRKLDTSR